MEKNVKQWYPGYEKRPTFQNMSTLNNNSIKTPQKQHQMLGLNSHLGIKLIKMPISQISTQLNINKWRYQTDLMIFKVYHYSYEMLDGSAFNEKQLNTEYQCRRKNYVETKIIYEQPIINLRQLLQKDKLIQSTSSNINIENYFFIIKSILTTLQKLSQKFGFFRLTQNMIGFDEQGQCKIWINQQLWKNQVMESMQKQVDAAEVIIQIFNSIQVEEKQQNIFQNWQNILSQGQGQWTINQLLQSIWQFSYQNGILIPPYLTSMHHANSSPNNMHKKSNSHLATPSFLHTRTKSPFKPSQKINSAKHVLKQKNSLKSNNSKLQMGFKTYLQQQNQKNDLQNQSKINPSRLNLKHNLDGIKNGQIKNTSHVPVLDIGNSRQNFKSPNANSYTQRMVSPRDFKQVMSPRNNNAPVNSLRTTTSGSNLNKYFKNYQLLDMKAEKNFTPIRNITQIKQPAINKMITFKKNQDHSCKNDVSNFDQSMRISGGNNIQNRWSQFYERQKYNSFQEYMYRQYSTKIVQPTKQNNKIDQIAKNNSNSLYNCKQQIPIKSDFSKVSKLNMETSSPQLLKNMPKQKNQNKNMAKIQSRQKINEQKQIIILQKMNKSSYVSKNRVNQGQQRKRGNSRSDVMNNRSRSTRRQSVCSTQKENITKTSSNKIDQIFSSVSKNLQQTTQKSKGEKSNNFHIKFRQQNLNNQLNEIVPHIHKKKFEQQINQQQNKQKMKTMIKQKIKLNRQKNKVVKLQNINTVKSIGQFTQSQKKILEQSNGNINNLSIANMEILQKMCRKIGKSYFCIQGSDEQGQLDQVDAEDSYQGNILQNDFQGK